MAFEIERIAKSRNAVPITCEEDETSYKRRCNAVNK